MPRRSVTFLSHEREFELAKRWRDKKDERALHELVNAHAPLANKLARRYMGYGLGYDDIAQESYVGLLEAANRFDPDVGVRFCTYAVWWMRAKTQNYILANWSIVRGGTSSAQKKLFFNLRKLRAKIAQKHPHLSKHETDALIAEIVGVEAADVETVGARMDGQETRLDAPLLVDGEPGSGTRLDFLKDESALPDEVAEHTIDHERRIVVLNRAVRKLPERTQTIVRERTLSDEPKGLEALGKTLGVSKERVRQIEMQGIAQIAAAFAGAR